ncbi:MAG: 2TM domain-containing protein [Thermoflexales bacterium]
MNISPKLRRFLQETTTQLAAMLFLAMINVVTSPDFPWAIFPIGGILISVLVTASRIFLADEKEDKLAGRAAQSQGVVHSAQVYKRRIDELMNATGDPLRRERLRELADKVGIWVKEVEAMSRRVEEFKRNEVIQSDLVNVPQAIEKLTAQLATETDPRVRASIERALTARNEQMQSLQKVQSLTRQAEVQLENTIAALGTIYSQALAMQSTDRAADYSQLSAEVDEQSRMLKDQLEALEEIKLDRQRMNLSNP